LSILHSTVFHSVCRTTHHRIVVDALRHLRVPQAEKWTDLFLVQYTELLAGSEAPDERFKDFKNHVLHVAEGNWGGATQEATRWYGRLVDALHRRDLAEAAFATGALSHYFSDPFMPLHTARSEEDTKIHQPLEWSIGRSYGVLQQIIEHDQGGYPELQLPRGSDLKDNDWLAQTILTGATLSHEHYDAVLQHYDLERALHNPLDGMDQECQDRIATCLAHAVVGFARVLERAITAAEVEPPPVETTLLGFAVTAASPVRGIVHHCRNLNDRMKIQAAFDEIQRIGKVIKNLPDDDREVRRVHAEEVLKLPLHKLDHTPAGLTGTLYGTGAMERFHPNRLLCSPAFPQEKNISTSWRNAQDKVKAATPKGTSAKPVAA
jgi:hypothetical protein